MDAQKSSYKVVDFTKKDIGEALKILHPLVPKQPILKDINFALKKGFFRGIKKRGKIVALAAGHATHDKVSLSYYYVDPFYRGKPLSLFFISHITALFAHKHIYIHSENPSDFELYIKKTDVPNEYEWVGFGDRLKKLLDAKWAA